MKVECEGVVVTGSLGEPYCQDALGAPAMWVEVSPAPSIDLDTVGAPFSAGFVLVGVFWALGKGIAVIIKLVRG